MYRTGRLRVASFVGMALIMAGLNQSVALAHGSPFTVKAGSAPTGTNVEISASSGSIVFHDVTTNLDIKCTSVDLRGSTKVGTADSFGIFTFNLATAALAGCSGPAGLTFKITGYGYGFVSVLDSTNGVSKNVFGNVVLHAEASSPSGSPACTFDFGSSSGSYTSSNTATVTPGSVSGTYTNSTQKQSLAPVNGDNLALWNMRDKNSNRSCIAPSILAQGNRFTITSTLLVRPFVAAYVPISIT